METIKTAVPALGIESIQKLNLITRSSNIDEPTECFNISMYEHIFEGIEKIKVTSIEFKFKNNYGKSLTPCRKIS